jgi:hypothetical protein
MALLTYMPHPFDPEYVRVAAHMHAESGKYRGGHTFKAYEPKEVDEGKDYHLFLKLSRNPWFAVGEPDAERKKRWEESRAALKMARDHRKAARELERSLVPAAVVGE